MWQCLFLHTAFSSVIREEDTLPCSLLFLLCIFVSLRLPVLPWECSSLSLSFENSLTCKGKTLLTFMKHDANASPSFILHCFDEQTGLSPLWTGAMDAFAFFWGKFWKAQLLRVLTGVYSFLCSMLQFTQHHLLHFRKLPCVLPHQLSAHSPKRENHSWDLYPHVLVVCWISHEWTQECASSNFIMMLLTHSSVSSLFLLLSSILLYLFHNRGLFIFLDYPQCFVSQIINISLINGIFSIPWPKRKVQCLFF